MSTEPNQAVPKLSVVILTYNRHVMLRECLESTQSITLRDCEIVVLDDASTDETPDVIQEFMQRDSRIRWVRNEANLGLVENSRKSFRVPRGQYICQVCDDDAVLPGNFEKKVAILDAWPKVGFVYSPFYIAEEREGTRIVRATVPANGASYSYIGGHDEFRHLFAGNYMHMLAIVFRRTLLDRLGGFDLDRVGQASDWDLALRYCTHMETAYVHEPLVMIRRHVGSSSETQKEGEIPEMRLAVWRKWLIEQEDPPVIDDETWSMMHARAVEEVQHYWRDRPDKLALVERELEVLRRQYTGRVSHRFGQQLRVVQMGSLGPAAVDQSAVSVTAPPALVWIGDPAGQGDEAGGLLGLARASLAAGLPARIEEHRGLGGERQWTDADRQLMERLAWTPLAEDQPHVEVWQTEPACFQPDPRARAAVGRSSFWATGLPRGWRDDCAKMDCIWVPSRFHFESYMEAGISAGKLRVLRECVDIDQLALGSPSATHDAQRGFKFVSVLDDTVCGGADILVSAWAQAFQPDEDVGLVLVCCTQRRTIEDIAAELKQYLAKVAGAGQVAPITLMPRPLGTSPGGVYRTIQACVQPSRGASWGRPVLEGMASGLPVIATPWGGNSEFMTHDNSYAVEYSVRPVPEGMIQRPGPGGHSWAEPSVDHLAALLREVFADTEGARLRGSRARADIAAGFSPLAVGSCLRDLLAEFGAEV